MSFIKRYTFSFPNNCIAINLLKNNKKKRNKGTGIATVVLSFFLSTYYIVIITWAMYYIFASFASDVPWKTCGNEWNTDDCWDGSLNASSKTTNNSKTPSEEFYR
jgi:solute carrier family 6 GABA transporter-like protein 6/8/11/12/13